jgi:hypothetical protein
VVAGFMVRAVSVAEVTVSTDVPDTGPRVARTTVEPARIALAEPPVAMIATEGSEVDQVASAVTSWVVKSEKCPIAVKATGAPAGTTGSSGATVIALRIASVTVIVAVEVRPESDAVITAVPEAFPVTMPSLTTAIEASDDDQVAAPVTSYTEPSVNVADATRCALVPLATFAALGVSDRDPTCAAVTVTFADAAYPWNAAKTVALPTAFPLSTPALTIETAVEPGTDHVAREVMSTTVPSK